METEKLATRPHAVMLALPLTGHVNPMLQLAYLLASQGVTVTFFNTEFNKPASPAKPARPDWDIRFEFISDGLPPEHGRACKLVELLDSFMDHSCRLFEETLQNGTLQPPPTCIIANTFIHPAFSIATRLGLPFVSFWTQSAASFASVSVVRRGFRPDPSDPHSLISCIPGVPPLGQDEMNGFLKCYDPSDFLFNIFVRPFATIKLSHTVILNTFEELETDTLQALRADNYPVLPVGPLLPPSFFSDDQQQLGTDEARCLAWLDQQGPASVVYVSFGTLAVINDDQLREFALGIEDSGHKFLWSVRHGITGGGKSEELPQGFIERTAEKGLVVGWAPQLKVLSHRAIGCFMTHCGWNSTLEGICAGVPMLCWWCISDQAMNCRLVEAKWRTGVGLERSSTKNGGVASTALVTRDEVKKKLRLLMGDDICNSELRAMGRRWKHAGSSAVAHPNGSSCQNLYRFVHDLRAMTHQKSV